MREGVGLAHGDSRGTIEQDMWVLQGVAGVHRFDSDKGEPGVS